MKKYEKIAKALATATWPVVDKRPAKGAQTASTSRTPGRQAAARPAARPARRVEQ